MQVNSDKFMKKLTYQDPEIKQYIDELDVLSLIKFFKNDKDNENNMARYYKNQFTPHPFINFDEHYVDMELGETYSLADGITLTPHRYYISIVNSYENPIFKKYNLDCVKSFKAPHFACQKELNGIIIMDYYFPELKQLLYFLIEIYKDDACNPKQKKIIDICEDLCYIITNYDHHGFVSEEVSRVVPLFIGK